MWIKINEKKGQQIHKCYKDFYARKLWFSSIDCELRKDWSELERPVMERVEEHEPEKKCWRLKVGGLCQYSQNANTLNP